MTGNGKVKGVTDLGVFPVLGQPNLNIKVDRDKGGALRAQRRRRQYGRSGGAWRHRRRRRCSRPTANSTSSCGLRPNIATTSTPCAISRSAIRRQRRQRLHSAERTRRHLARYRRVLHLSRAQRSASSRSSSACAAAISAARSRRRRSASQRNVKLPTGYRIVWAGEFEELQQAKERLEVIVPISLLLIMVLLYGLFNSLRDSLLALAGIPVRGRRRHDGALFHGSGFQHLGGHRLHLAVRRVGHERHSDHHLL